MPQSIANLPHSRIFVKSLHSSLKRLAFGVSHMLSSLSANRSPESKYSRWKSYMKCTCGMQSSYPPGLG